MVLTATGVSYRLVGRSVWTVAKTSEVSASIRVTLDRVPPPSIPPTTIRIFFFVKPQQTADYVWCPTNEFGDNRHLTVTVAD